MAPAVAIPIIMAAAAATASAIGSIQSGNAQAAVASYNAKDEEQRAAQAQNQAAVQATLDDQKTRRVVGEQAAAYGAASVDSTGTPLMVMMDQTTQGEMQRQLDLYRGATNAQSDLQQAQADEAAAAQDRSAGNMNAGLTLLTGAATGAKNYYSMTGAYPTGGSTAGSSPAAS